MLLNSFPGASQAVLSQMSPSDSLFSSTSSSRHFSRSSSAFAFVACFASMNCDIDIDTKVLSSLVSNEQELESTGARSATMMACSPPRTHPRVSHISRSISTPSTALPCKKSHKTRRKRGGGGFGGGDDDDDGMIFWFSGGGDDGFNGGDNGGNGDDGDEGFDKEDPLTKWLQDVLLVWSMFCAWSTITMLRYVTSNADTSRSTSPAFATLSYSR